MFISFATILDMTKTIEQEQWLRICPKPYLCVIPDPEWKARPPMGLTIYKRVEVVYPLVDKRPVSRIRV